MDKIDISDDYVSLITKVRKSFEDTYAKCEGPESTANIVIKAIEAQKPKAAYNSTKDAKQSIMIKKLMAEKRFGDMIFKMINK